MSPLRAVSRAFEQAGFKEGSIPLAWENPPEAVVSRASETIRIDGHIDEWSQHVRPIKLGSDTFESGFASGASDLQGEIRFMWDEQFLYFAAEVQDDALVFRMQNGQIFRDDLLEFYVDPQGDGLHWYSKEDFQVGFRIEPKDRPVKCWSWFQGGENPIEKGNIRAFGETSEGLYVIEGAVRWAFLGIRPEANQVIRFSVALHDIDRDRSEAKYNWFFRNEGELNRYELGKLLLEGDHLGSAAE